MSPCCSCQNAPSGGGGSSGSLPLICMVPRQGTGGQRSAHASSKQAASKGSSGPAEFKFLDEAYIKKHFKLPQRALYLDQFRRPLITFPLTEGGTLNFNLDKKQKINQQILDGYLDKSAAITAPSVFPYAKKEAQERKKSNEEDEELIYILQLPDWEFTCPVHNETIRTPRFIWHSCKKTKGPKSSDMKQGGGPLSKPKPWLLSRHTDFDLKSQW